TQDAADTVGVQSSALSDLGQQITLPPEFQDWAVFGGAVGQDSFPQIPCLGDLTGARLRRWQRVLAVSLAEGFSARGGFLVLADAVDQAVARGDKQEAAEVVGIGEAPAGLAKTTEHICPDRLEDVGGIELGTEGSREVPGDRLAQVRLIGKEDAL